MTELMIAIGVGFLVLFPSVIYIGKVADKFGRKKFFPPLILSIAIAFFLVPVAQFSASLILFIILTPFMLIGLLGLNTNMHTWAQDTLPEGKKGQFYGIFNITLTVPQIVGGIIAGAISEIFGRFNIFILAGIFFIASIPFFLLVRETLDVER
jgi:MFS family permease